MREDFEEYVEQSKKYRNYTKVITAVNALLGVAAIVILLVKNFCGC